MRRAVLAALGVLLAVACARAAPATAYDGLFAPDSYRNRPLSASAPIDALSSLYVNDLASKVSRLGVWVNPTKFSTRVYPVPAGQPTTPVAAYDPDHPDDPDPNPALAAQWQAVPLPPGAQPADGTDHHLAVYQPGNGGTLWEFWRFEPNGGHPRAQYGGRMDDVGANPGYFTDGYGATASGIPLLVGLQRLGELRAGTIDHAVNLVVNHAGVPFRWPAQRGDGSNPVPTAVQEGMRFRLPASLNIAALHLPPYATMVARAVQRYGMVVTDTTGDEVGAAFDAEDPTPTGQNPYLGPTGIFGAVAPDQDGQFLDFPWTKLQLLR